MKLQVINNGIIAYPESEKDYASIQQYQFTELVGNMWIPKPLFKYWNGWDEELQEYHYKFNLLKKQGLVYDIAEGKVAKGKMNYKDGVYEWDIANNNVFSSLRFITNDFNKPELALPLHKELSESIKLLNKLDLMKNDYDYDSLAMLRALYNKVNELINIIKTTPVVNGSPLNPAIIIIDSGLLEDLEATANASSQEVDLSEETIDNIIKVIKGK